MHHVRNNWATSWQNQQCGCAPSEDSDQPGHPPSLSKVFAMRMKKHSVLSYPLSAQRRLWSDWTDAQAVLSLRLAHSHFVCFVMRRLNSIFICTVFLLIYVKYKNAILPHIDCLFCTWKNETNRLVLSQIFDWTWIPTLPDGKGIIVSSSKWLL